VTFDIAKKGEKKWEDYVSNTLSRSGNGPIVVGLYRLPREWERFEAILKMVQANLHRCQVLHLYAEEIKQDNSVLDLFQSPTPILQRLHIHLFHLMEDTATAHRLLLPEMPNLVDCEHSNFQFWQVARPVMVHMRTLEFATYEIVPSQLLNALDSCPNLRYLRLNIDDWGYTESFTPRGAITMPHLDCLRICGDGLKLLNKAASKLNFPSLTQLEYLELENRDTMEGMAQFLSTACSTLESIELGVVDRGEPLNLLSPQPLLAALENMSKLNYLEIRRAIIHESFFDRLRRDNLCPKLKVISLEFCEVAETGDGGKSVLDLFQARTPPNLPEGLTRLKISLSDCTYDEACVAEISCLWEEYPDSDDNEY